MRKWRGGALLAFLVVLGGTVRAAPSVDDAVAAYLQLDFATARRGFEAIANDPNRPPADREDALRHLALMDWRIAGDFATAEKRLDQADVIATKPAQNALAIARERRAAGRFEDARVAASRALLLAANDGERQAASLELCQTAQARLRDKALATYGAADREELAAALKAAQAFLADPPTSSDLALIALKLAVRAGDGGVALAAWRSFVRRPPFEMATTVLGASDKVFGARLSGYHGETRFAHELVRALIDARLFREAMLLADKARLKSAEFADVRAYQHFVDVLSAETEEYYQHTAQGLNEAAAWQAKVIAQAQELWSELTWSGARPDFKLAAFPVQIEKRFGAYASIGETSGHVDLHMGHIFIDRTETVAQFGRSASLRFVALDWMVSDGYESWVWDGAQAHGGWAKPDAIYQVRPAYADGPLYWWRALSDPVTRAQREARIVAAEAQDAARVAQDPAGYLPGLSLRLGWLGLNELYSDVQAKFGAGPGLKANFIAAYEEAILKTSIFIHEGRHVLDKREFTGASALQSEELEYRAKLSELQFSDFPRLDIGTIFNEQLGADTPHGRGAHRVVEGILAWANDHAGEIKGLDLAKPIQPQLVLLSDDQWHKAAAAQDPWAAH